ncbi:FAD-dependent thymidylate synthase [Chlamydiifrater phoenicopteri]|uniref:FAD-dependent thymidylate synthase n=1 Tax=Chlamydiifrater phoenicopteri TaxID=2681469 RepID=UPI001BCB2FBB|nr:FAD-dependent thymidylate synthase [Chlamydiifrater phoenicopteri]
MSDNSEVFSDKQKKILSQYVSNLEGNVFVLKNLPEVIKGALFSKYSRSILGVRAVLLKEFLESEESGFIAEDGVLADNEEGVRRASAFYERVLDGFGDDSIGELGGAHLAIERVSMLAAKILEDSRIGGSPLEKSTRYVYFDQKVNGEYSYFRDPILMTSAFKTAFLSTCDNLFKTYSDLVPEVTTLFEKMYPRDPEVSKSSYNVSIRARVLDCLRGLLPTATLTNVGFFGNGRFWQNLIQRLQLHNLSEIKGIGSNVLTELKSVIPSFVSRAECHHRHHKGLARFQESMVERILGISKKMKAPLEPLESGVKLVYGDPEGIYKVCAGILFPHTNVSFSSLIDQCKKMPKEELNSIIEAVTYPRENRRHKSPRGLECAEFAFDIVADFGGYRDLQRHRMLTQERQLLTACLGYDFPKELLDTPMEKPFRQAVEQAGEVYRAIAEEFPEEAQYVVPMAYHIRWMFHINARALQWLCELRSQPQGHINYRSLSVAMARAVCDFDSRYEPFFKFVNYDDVGLGRLEQEIRKEAKVNSFSSEAE